MQKHTLASDPGVGLGVVAGMVFGVLAVAGVLGAVFEGAGVLGVLGGATGD